MAVIEYRTFTFKEPNWTISEKDYFEIKQQIAGNNFKRLTTVTPIGKFFLEDFILLAVLIVLAGGLIIFEQTYFEQPEGTFHSIVEWIFVILGLGALFKTFTLLAEIADYARFMFNHNMYYRRMRKSIAGSSDYGSFYEDFYKNRKK